MKSVEVKATGGDTAGSLKGNQGWGGEKFTADRLKRAADGKGNYGKAGAKTNAEKAKDWLRKSGDKTLYEKQDVFVDPDAEDCKKAKPSNKKPWDAVKPKTPKK